MDLSNMEKVEVQTSPGVITDMSKVECNFGSGFKTVWSKTDGFGGLKFKAVQAMSTVKWYAYGSPRSTLFYFSYDGINWQRWYDNTAIPLAQVGDFVYVKGDNPNGIGDDPSFVRFQMTGKIAASGNINSLIDNGDGSTVTSIPDFCYNYMFQDCTSLISAPSLPSTSVGERTCFRMFWNCSSLTTCPELPATSLGEECYLSMFGTCDNLTKPAYLPATILAPGCYESMFADCDEITETLELPATELVTDCYRLMFSYSPKLKKIGKINANILANSSLQSMFRGCSALKVATSGDENKKIFTCPTTEDLTDATLDMFRDTAGTFTGTPTAGDSYYWYE